MDGDPVFVSITILYFLKRFVEPLPPCRESSKCRMKQSAFFQPRLRVLFLAFFGQARTPKSRSAAQFRSANAPIFGNMLSFLESLVTGFFSEAGLPLLMRSAGKRLALEVPRLCPGLLH